MGKPSLDLRQEKRGLGFPQDDEEMFLVRTSSHCCWLAGCGAAVGSKAEELQEYNLQWQRGKRDDHKHWIGREKVSDSIHGGDIGITMATWECNRLSPNTATMPHANRSIGKRAM